MKKHPESKEEDEGSRKSGILELSNQESKSLSKLAVNPHCPQIELSFYECFALRGIQLHRVEPGLIVCFFRVPPRLINKDGELAPGAIANLVDDVGGLLVYKEGHPMSVSMSISISYVSTAKVDDELEVSARLLGQLGFISGTVVLLKNKATGEIVAEGRHTIFSKPASKI